MAYSVLASLLNIARWHAPLVSPSSVPPPEALMHLPWFRAVQEGVVKRDDPTPLRTVAGQCTRSTTRHAMLATVIDANTGDNAVMLAARLGRVHALRALVLDIGASVQTHNKEGHTPVSLAAHFGHTDVLRFLGDELGMDLQMPAATSLNHRARVPTSALHAACRGGDLYTVKMLIEGLHLDCTHSSFAAYDLPRGFQRSCASRSVFTHEPLALDGQRHVQEELETFVAELRTRYAFRAPIHTACAYGHLNLVKYLVDIQHVDVNADAGTVGKFKPIHFAAINGHASVIEFLLERGAHAEALMRIGWSVKLTCWTSADAAAAFGHKRITHLLQPPSYMYLNKLGQGSTANVFKACLRRDASEKDGQVQSASGFVAVKVHLLPEPYHADADAHTIHEEIELLSSVQHPNILTYHRVFHQVKQFIDVDAVDEPGLHVGSPVPLVFVHVVMDYCAGGPLSHLPRIPFEDEMWQIVGQVLYALKALHEHQPPIRHGDLKPDNICLMAPLSGDGHQVHVKLVDFGLAEITMRTVRRMAFEGTRCFHSPERQLNEPFNLADDIWAAGLTLLYVGTGLASEAALLREAGHPPYPGTPNYTPRIQQLVAEFSKLHGFPLGQIIKRMLSHNAVDRPSAARLLQDFPEFPCHHPRNRSDSNDSLFTVL